MFHCTMPKKNIIEGKRSEDLASGEMIYLQSKNTELAKALAEAKVSLKQTMDEREILQKQLLTMSLKNSELMNYIKHIDQAARKSINAIVVSSNYITEIVQMTMANMRKSDTNLSFLHNLSDTSRVSPYPASSKIQQAVKPMIDGHVIYRPTISLRRVNELPLEEIQRLRTTTQTQNTSNTLMDQGDNAENSPYGRLSVAANSHSYNDHSNHTPIDTGNEVQDDYIEQPSSISEAEHINNRLHTITELTEDLMDNSPRSEDDLSTIANASTSSVNIPGNTSQGPLLSGVFRDVRVYLSPMQNMSQYLNSLPTVTTERGTYSSKKMPKKHYTPRSVTLDKNNQCVVTIKSGVPGLDQSNDNLGSANSSFEDPNNSILTSTRISSNFEEACRARNLNYVKKPRWSDNYQNSTVNENMHMFNRSPQDCFNNSSKWVPKNENSLRGHVQNYSASSYPSSKMMSSTAYDPLEGPSTLLDSSSNMIQEKLETLSMLGLKPKTSNDQLPHTPSTPATAVLKRRERDLQDISPKKKNKSIYITKRKLDTKTTVISSKIISSRKSFSPLKASKLKKSLSSSVERESISPLKQKNIIVKPKKSSIDSVKRKQVEGDPVKKKRKKKETEIKKELSLSQNSSMTSVSTSSTTITSDAPKVRKNKSKPKNSNENEVNQKRDTQKAVISTKVIRSRKSFSPLSLKIKKSLSNSIKRESISPLKQKNLIISKRKNSLETVKEHKVKRDSLKKKRKAEESDIKTELNASHNSSMTSISTSSTVTNDSQKVKRKRTMFKNSNENEVHRKSKSPQKTPKQKRPARSKIQSLKEPSLSKKMRRS